MKVSILTAASLFAVSTFALAGPAEDANAHFKAIAAGDVAKITQTYASNAALQWVGGPLDGTYAGADKIKEVWSNFVKAQGMLELTMGKLEESANPKGATITANVEFKGKSSIKVRYVLVYREGQLVNEVWQIDPKLAMGY